MARPKHLEAETGYYFITTNTEKRKSIFRDTTLGRMVIDALYYLRDSGRVCLYGFVVMPDHVHILLSVSRDESLSKVMHSLKSFTAKKLNRATHQSGKTAFTVMEYGMSGMH